MNNLGKPSLPIGIDDFRKVRENGAYFVDKSLLIKDLIDVGAEVTLFTRPRRFGKTVNMSMLRYFFDKTGDYKDLFKGLQIMESGDQYLQHQGRYPVVFLTLKNIKASQWEDCYAQLTKCLSDVYAQHRYLLDSGALSEQERDHFNDILNRCADQAVLNDSLGELTQYLHRYHGEPVVVLLDEYDTPLHQAYLKQFSNKLLEVLRGLFGNVFKGNTALKYGVITGILRVAKENLFSGLNNLRTYSVLNHSFHQYFGLTEPEVKQLLADYELAHDLSEVRQWYNGYQFGQESNIYNPWSLISFVSGVLEGEGEVFRPYWVNTGSPDLLSDVAAKGSVEDKLRLERLLRGEAVEVEMDEGLTLADLQHHSAALWSVLLFSGYLTAISTRDYEYATVRIPNQEVRLAFERMVTDWFESALSSGYLTNVWQLLVTGEIDLFKDYFRDYVSCALSYFDVSHHEPERFYHALVLGLLVELQYHGYQVRSNRESGMGRYDIMLVPEDTTRRGVVIEFKRATRSTGLEGALVRAHEQIAEKGYVAELQAQGIEKILTLAIAFEGKQVAIDERYV